MPFQHLKSTFGFICPKNMIPNMRSFLNVFCQSLLSFRFFNVTSSLCLGVNLLYACSWKHVLTVDFDSHKLKSHSDCFISADDGWTDGLLYLCVVAVIQKSCPCLTVFIIKSASKSGFVTVCVWLVLICFITASAESQQQSECHIAAAAPLLFQR